MKDHIEDLMEVNAKLHRHIDRLQQERDQWKRVAEYLADFISNTSSDIPPEQIIDDTWMAVQNG